MTIHCYINSRAAKYKFGRFLECQIIFVTWHLQFARYVVMPSALGPVALRLRHTHQVNLLCPCYNYYICDFKHSGFHSEHISTMHFHNLIHYLFGYKQLITEAITRSQKQKKLIFLYLKTRHWKYYTLNIIYIKLHKLSWIRNQQNPQKFDPHKINKYTLQ